MDGEAVRSVPLYYRQTVAPIPEKRFFEDYLGDKMEERLQKILSRYGVASRRKAEELISERRVRVNGNTASLGDTAVDGEDVIEVDGVRLKKEPERL